MTLHPTSADRSWKHFTPSILWQHLGWSFLRVCGACDKALARTHWSGLRAYSMPLWQRPHMGVILQGRLVLCVEEGAGAVISGYLSRHRCALMLAKVALVVVRRPELSWRPLSGCRRARSRF